MERQLVALLLVGLCVCGLFSGALTASVPKRVTREVADTNDTANSTCQNLTPCGWAVYVPFTRRADYFMKNTCECPQGKSCTQSDDDLTTSAYIYRCSDNVGSLA